MTNSTDYENSQRQPQSQPQKSFISNVTHGIHEIRLETFPQMAPQTTDKQDRLVVSAV